MPTHAERRVLDYSPSQLYDLVADPFEMNDLQGKTKLPEDLRMEVEKYRGLLRHRPDSPGAAGGIPEQIRKKLESLGYLKP